MLNGMNGNAQAGRRGDRRARGFAGLALAIALRQALGEAFAVTVVDPALGARRSRRTRAPPRSPPRRGGCSRRSGSGRRSRRDAQPILDMVVTDSKLDDAVRPTFLTFGGEVEEGEPFAHMIENRHLVDALVEQGEGARRRSARRRGDRFRRTRANAIDVTLAGGEKISRAAAGRRRRRALGNPRAGRHRHARLELRSVGDRHHGRARARSQRPRRRAFPAGRPVRDPAAHRQALVDRVDRGTRAKPSASSRCRTTNSTPSWKSASACKLGDIEVVGPRRAFPLGLFTARSVHRRAARADRRRRACHSSDRRAGAQHGAARRRGAGRGDGRRGAARARYRRAGRARALSALAALRHNDDGRRDRRAQPAVLQPAPTCCGWCATSASAWSSACRRSSACSSARPPGFTGEVPKLLRGEAL